MKCEELQFNLSLYADDDLTADEQSILDDHLLHCPPCRVKLSELQSLRNDLRNMSQPAVPSDLVYSVRSAVANQLSAEKPRNWFNLSDDWNEWLQFKMMPYSVGVALSVFLLVGFVISFNRTQDSATKVLETARVNSNRNVVLVNPNQYASADYPMISNEELAALRSPVSSESPSLNTNGAFLALATSLTKGKMKDNEVTFVANVLSNGLAQVTQVVEAPKNHRSMEELSNALENDKNFAPFVSADIDKRSDVVQVVFKIQRVDVFDKKPAKKKTPVK